MFFFAHGPDERINMERWTGLWEWISLLKPKG